MTSIPVICPYISIEFRVERISPVHRELYQVKKIVMTIISKIIAMGLRPLIFRRNP